ncbi:hypothetical protein MACK_004131 [Theileria orientalis]|uniref:ABC transporter domain-containing protein n=1 Tax=Theileria orientalis TaxID=68886 RepID=A0A976SK62_THEOR|nr:hypothetical protein MACK_004131 [Theileria orientalis]
MSKKYDTQLENINFEVKRGQTIFITGSKGSGKSNLIKAILGDMTLVGGSMAVIPLYTSMPIFYASQDIFIQQGTIRSNITFGYKFDENLYNTVLKAVELEFDISTWEKADLRVVSDNGLSLSGGQRVRIEMARAVYAYLVFHKVNKEYNNSKCSFLMCLDASFHGLDPYVSKNIFNSLFNAKNGMLVKEDLSVVLTSSKQILDTCTKAYNPEQFKNETIYNIKNKKLTYLCTMHEFIKNKLDQLVDHKYLTTSRSVPCPLNSLTNDMISMCTAGTNDKTTRPEVIKQLYNDSFINYVKEQFGNSRFNPYYVFMKPALFSFTIYILLTVAVNILDYVKFVLSTNLSDYITKCINDFKKGNIVELDEIKDHSNSALKLFCSKNKETD